MKMKLKSINSRIILEPYVIEEKKSLLYYKENKVPAPLGTVIQIPQDKDIYEEGNEIKLGMVVMFDTQTVKVLKLEDKDYFIVELKDILAIVENDEIEEDKEV